MQIVHGIVNFEGKREAGGTNDWDAKYPPTTGEFDNGVKYIKYAVNFHRPMSAPPTVVATSFTYATPVSASYLQNIVSVTKVTKDSFNVRIVNPSDDDAKGGFSFIAIAPNPATDSD